MRETLQNTTPGLPGTGPACLEVALLDNGRVAMEIQPTDQTVGRDRSVVEHELRNAHEADSDRAFLMLGLTDSTVRFAASVEFWRGIAASFVHALLVAPDTEERRAKAVVEFTPEDLARRIAEMPPMPGGERVTADRLNEFIARLHAAYRKSVSENSAPVEDVLKSLAPGHRLLCDRVHFHLVENKRTPDTPFAFLATYSVRDGTNLRHLPLDHALREHANDTKRLLSLLSSVHKAAARSNLVRSLLDSGEIFHPLAFSSQDALQFLREVPVYEESGVLCRIPKWWTGAPRSISVTLAIGNAAPSTVGKNAILDCRPVLHVDGEPLTEEEARHILEHYEGLAMVKGRWVAVDREQLGHNLALFEKAQKLAKSGQFTLGEAMRMLLGQPPESGAASWSGDVSCGPWLKDVFDRLNEPARLQQMPPPRDLKATLRPYQHSGLSWLLFLHELGFGQCLADDMGLGKTVQVLAMLLSLKERKAAGFGPSLLVVPASLVGNWMDEATRFTPGLRILTLHGQAAKDAARTERDADSHDLVVTTYGMTRETGWIAKKEWFYVILDEAQAIKNPAAAQTRAVKAIPARHRLVLTGTPIENRLGDLWSLFDFLNKGLLGSVQSFKRFATSLEKDPSGYARLRNVVRPCILRRMKTDKRVIADLPEKVNLKAYANLTRAQALLYRQLQTRFMEELESADGIRRRGLILAYLMKFKQVCNHPDQYAGEGSYKETDSGKFARLREICETILEKRERVLVFTQFREIIPALDAFLASVFGHSGLCLHGGTPVDQRKGLVARFQSDSYLPYFVLSLKAGGTGLNLTAARHVVHFDRWWNPAVERQAEDRAFRIGQKANVMVHAFVCRGTIEERIDDMIAGKTGLAEQVLGGEQGEKWLTELSNSDLRKMVELSEGMR